MSTEASVTRRLLTRARRTVVFGVLLLGVAGVGYVATAGPAPQAVDSGAIVTAKLGLPGDCFVRANVFLAVPDQRDLDGGSGWVEVGAVFRGTAEDAAIAFGGEILARGANEIWISASDASGRHARQLRELAPNTWYLADTVRRVACASDGGPE